MQQRMSLSLACLYTYGPRGPRHEFRSCDLDLDSMTFILTLYVAILKTYTCTSRNITTPYSQV